MSVESENYIRQFGIIFFANQKIIYIVTACFILLSFVFLLFFKPVYSIDGSIIVKSKKLGPPPEVTQEYQQALRIIPPSTQDILTEIELIRDENNIRNTVKCLLDENISLQPEPSGLLYPLQKMKESIKNSVEKILSVFSDKSKDVSRSLTDELDEQTARIIGNLSVVNVPGSYVIKVNLLHNDPHIGQTILSAVLRNYLEFRLGVYTHQSAGDLFEKQKKEYEANLASLYQQRLALLNNYGLTDIDKEISIQMDLIERTIESIDALSTTLEIKTDEFYLVNTTYDDYLKNPDRMFYPFPYDFDDREIDNYSTLHNQLLSTYSDLKKNYNERSRQVRMVEGQLEDVWGKLMFLIDSRIQLKKNELASLRTRFNQEAKKLADLRNQNKRLNNIKMEIVKIDQQINLNNNNYEVFYHKIEEFNIEQADTVSQFSNVQIIGEIHIPQQPVFPQKKVVMIIAVFTGIFFGISAGFIKEFFDHTFKTPEHVKEYLDLPVIGSIQMM